VSVVFVDRYPWSVASPSRSPKTVSADLREPIAGKRTAEKKVAALASAVEQGKHGKEEH